MNNKACVIKWGGNILYMLLIFLFVADPTNTILGLKSVVFALLLLYNFVFLKADWTNLRFCLIPILAALISWIFAVIQGNNVDFDEFKAFLMSFSPLLLLLWSSHYDVVKLSVLPVTLTVIVVLVLFWICFFSPQFEGLLYIYMDMHDNTIMMSNRVFLGIKMFCMYPKATVAFLPVFGFVLYKALNEKKRRFIFILIIALFFHLFVISGTRSSMLLPILLACMILFIYGRNGRYMRYMIYPGVLMFCILFFVLLAVLLMESDEPSNMIKYAHLVSYKELFTENPEYLLFGQGPGTEFYTKGFRMMTMKTEWTYLELLRNYGLFCLPILYVIMLPLFKLLLLARKHESALAMASAYFIYLIIAGTNPLLLSSTGMLVVLSGYSYVDNLKANNKL